MTSYKSTFFECGCGFKCIQSGNASWHKKKCDQEMKSSSKTFVLEEDHVFLEHKYTSIETSVIDVERQNMIAKLREENDDLSAIVKRQKSAIIKLVDNGHFDDDDDDDCEGSGLIYFVRDTVVTDRGKIGRTKNTDVKKLKSRYSTFGSPRIQCYFSMDIKNDEAKLKARLRAIGCMMSNTEMVTNCDMAISIFCEFASES